jgi:hypothetical protein
VSWYQSGNPPIVGSLLTGPTRWSAAWAGKVMERVNSEPMIVKRRAVVAGTDAPTAEVDFELSCTCNSPRLRVRLGAMAALYSVPSKNFQDGNRGPHPGS